MIINTVYESPPRCLREDEHRDVVSKVILNMKKVENSDVSLDEWADFACLSKFELISAFKKLTGIPPMTFHNAEKLEIAKKLLVFDKMPATQVCFEIGFESLGSFVTKFGSNVGITPANYARTMSAFGFAELFAHSLLSRRPVSRSAGTSIEVHFDEPRTAIKPSLIAAVFSRAYPSGTPAGWRFVPPTRRLALFHSGLTGYCLAASMPLWPRLSELVNFHPALIGRSALTRTDGEIRLMLRPPTIFDPPITLAIPALFCREFAEVSGHC